MNDNFADAMRQATTLTRAGNLDAATRLIQQALAGNGAPPTSEHASETTETAPLKIVGPANTARNKKDRPVSPLIEHDPQPVEQAAAEADASPNPRGRTRRPLRDVVRLLREGRMPFQGAKSLPGLRAPHVTPHVPEGAQFAARSHASHAGARDYKLYRPASAPDRPRGLIVMLHGCTQSPDDFATGTGMNAVAEDHGLLVAYPGQTSAHNASSCWNWFNPADQRRGAGEPAILASLTRELMTEFGLERDAVFVAGLSAGGAMAAVMGEAYPDIYAAVGVHSGLAAGSASDVVSAFAAMRGEAGTVVPRPTRNPAPGPRVRTIVFHGAADATVHPSNAARIVANAADDRLSLARDNGKSQGGHTYTRTIYTRSDGNAAVEFWLIDGAGHAWSGGQAAGSYTNPQGPEASSEMARFFLDPK